MPWDILSPSHSIIAHEKNHSAGDVHSTIVSPPTEKHPKPRHPCPCIHDTIGPCPVPGCDGARRMGRGAGGMGALCGGLWAGGG